MGIRRLLYVTQDSLTVWRRTRSALAAEITFQNSDEGLRLFAAYLERSAAERTLMLVDVIEEEFATDTIPDLSATDRKGLISRRLAKRFSRTPYRLGRFQGKSRRATDRFNVVFSAILNHELLDPWLGVLDEKQVPLVGITSVPLVAADLLREFRKPAENALLLTRHQDGRLRQVFIKSGQPVSARLSRVNPDDPVQPGDSLAGEVMQSRKYLERSRLLTQADKLDVYLVADSAFADAAFAEASGIEIQLHAINPSEAAARFGLTGEIDPASLEILFLAFCATKPVRDGYEPPERTNYGRLLRIRQATIGLAAAAAIACSIASGALLTKALKLGRASATIEAQITRLEETYRRENEQFEPIRADSHEMKLAVDTGDYILANALPVDWVMQEVGKVLGDYLDVEVERLDWQIVAPADPNGRDRQAGGRDRAAPVPIPRISAVSASLSGEIRPYDGDLRQVFARIDRLAADLQTRTGFDRVAVLEYPIDARPVSALSGEVRRRGDNPTARFRLEMTLEVDHEPG